MSALSGFNPEIFTATNKTTFYTQGNLFSCLLIEKHQYNYIFIYVVYAGSYKVA